MALNRISSGGITDGTISNVDIASDAAIDGSKISGNLGAQDLVVDTDVLVVDATNDRVGVGTASPNVNLHISATGAPALRIQDADGTTQFTNILHSNGLTTFEGKDGTGDGAFRFRGASTLNDYLRIDSSGRVGIGTGTPEEKLEVIGNIYLRSSETADTGKTQRLYGGAYADNPMTMVYSNNDASFNRLYLGGGTSGGEPASHIYFHTGTVGTKAAGTARMIINSDGNVGIGTTSPGDLLHLNKNDATSVGIRLSNTEGIARIVADNDLINISADQHRFTSEAGTDRLRIDSSGNVGIGTTLPQTLLEIKNDTASTFYDTTIDTSLLLSGTPGAGNGNFGGSIGFSRLDSVGRINAAIAIKQTTADADQCGLSFFTHSSTNTGASLSESLVIDHAGSVGIGETTPGSKLHIKDGYITVQTTPDSTFGVQEFLRVDNGASVGDRALQGFELLNSGVRWHSITHNLDITSNGSAYTYTQGLYSGSNLIEFINGDLRIYADAQVTSGSADNITPSRRVTIKADGNVGIGQISPAQLLDVNGDALINNLTIGKGAGSLEGNTAIGEDVLGNATTGGIQNTGVGWSALLDLTTGSQNTAVGRSAGANITTGTNNTFIGRVSGFNLIDGNSNVALGESALYYSVAGSAGTAIGRRSQLYANNTTTGYTNTNVSVGYESLRGSTTAADNTGNQNVAIGYVALQLNSSGSGNTALGYFALKENTTGGSNVAVGQVSLEQNTTGNNNIAVGNQALEENTTASNNIAIGTQALESSVAGSNGIAIGFQSQYYRNNTATAHTNSNISVGYQALRGSTTAADNTGTSNVAVGYQTLINNTSGYTNTAIGYVTLFDNTTGLQNVAVGGSVLANNTTGNNNTALGYQALNSSVGANNGVAIGLQSQLYYNNTVTSHSNTNTAVGYQSLRGPATPADNTGLGNTVVGYQAMYDNSSASLCTAVGTNALGNNTTGNSNTAIGSSSLITNTTGEHNVAVGNTTLSTSTVVDRCTAVGYESQRYSDSTGTNKDGNNTSVGWRALRGSPTAANNTGINNTAVGNEALILNTSGDHNVAIGLNCLASNTTGYSNSAVGMNALLRNTTGYLNTAIGRDAGRYDQSNNDTANFNNCTYLGRDTKASGDNQVILGDSSTTVYLSSGTTQVTSDERDKADIRDTILGLDFINALRPVDYRWDPRVDYFDTEVYEEEVTETVEVSNPAYVEDGDEPQYIEETVTKMVTKDRLVPVPKDGSRKRNRFHHGLIAQEVKAAADAMGVDFAGYQDHKVNGGLDKLTMGYTELIAPLIKAVQELSAENAALKARLDALEAG